MHQQGGGESPDGTGLDKARRALGLTSADVYVRYVGVTGVASEREVDEHLSGAGAVLLPREHDKVVLALNECFLERGLPDRLPFLEP